MTMALAPMVAALATMRSTACRRASSSNWVYSVISPPASDRRLAMMLPPSPRLRTTTPNTWPLTSRTRCPGTFSVVTTSIVRVPPARSCRAFSVAPDRDSDFQRNGRLSVDLRVSRRCVRMRIEESEQPGVHETGHGSNAIDVRLDHLQNERLAIGEDGEGGRTVRMRRHKAVRAHAIWPRGPAEKRADGLDAHVPLGERWHAESRVGFEQSDQFLHVTVFPRSDV